MLAAGSDAMIAADEVYAELKSSAKKDASVKGLVDQIAKRFKGQGSSKQVDKEADKKG